MLDDRLHSLSSHLEVRFKSQESNQARMRFVAQ